MRLQINFDARLNPAEVEKDGGCMTNSKVADWYVTEPGRRVQEKRRGGAEGVLVAQGYWGAQVRFDGDDQASWVGVGSVKSIQ